MSKAILTSIRIPEDVHDFIETRRKNDGRTFTYIILEILREYIELDSKKMNSNSKNKDD